MDAFLTAPEKALRARLRERLGKWLAAVGKGGVPPESVLEDLRREVGCPAFLVRGLVLEETALRSPRLCRELFRNMGEAPRGEDSEPPASALAEFLGSAAFVLEACYRVASAKNLFVSVLTEAGMLQQGMADLAAALEAARFEAYRSLLLLDRGETAQGTVELRRTMGRILGLRTGILRLASALLGREWLVDNLPADFFSDQSGSGAAPGEPSPQAPSVPDERSDS